MSKFEAKRGDIFNCNHCDALLSAHSPSNLECPPPSPDLSRDEIKALARDGGSCTACQWNAAAESKCILTGDCHRVVCSPEDPPRFAAAIEGSASAAGVCTVHGLFLGWPCPDCPPRDVDCADWERSETPPGARRAPLTATEVKAREKEYFAQWTNGQRSALATQVGGGHYKDMAIQPFEYIHKNGIGFAEGCAIKYLSRWKSKGGVEDLRKARHFIDLLIEAEVGP